MPQFFIYYIGLAIIIIIICRSVFQLVSSLVSSSPMTTHSEITLFSEAHPVQIVGGIWSRRCIPWGLPVARAVCPFMGLTQILAQPHQRQEARPQTHDELNTWDFSFFARSQYANPQSFLLIASQLIKELFPWLIRLTTWNRNYCDE